MPDTPGLLDIHGRKITHAEVAQSLRVTVFASSLGTIWMAMTVNMPLYLFMEAIGSGGLLIGLLTTVRMLAAAMQIPAALLSEEFGSRKRFMVTAGVIHRALWFAVAALALQWKPGAWWLAPATIATVGLSDLFGNATGVAWVSWMTDLVPARTGGRFWGRRQSIVTFASLAGMALAGRLMDAFQNPATGKTTPFGFALLFALAACCGVMDILLHIVPREPMPGTRTAHPSLWHRLVAPLRNRDFRLLIASMGTWTFGFTMITTFVYVYLKRYFPVTYSHVSALVIANALGTAATGFIMGSLLDRLGPRNLTAVMLAFAPLTLVAWFFVDTTFVTFRLPWIGFCTVPQVIVVLAPAMFANGSIFTNMFPCQMRLLAEFSTVSGRTVSIALYWASVGLIGALGSLTGGCLMDWFNKHPLPWTLRNGTGFSFFHVLIVVFAGLMWLVALPMLLRIRPRGVPAQ